MRAALITSLRGGASSFIEYIWLDSPFDVIMDELVDCYCITATHDILVYEFHQPSQERNEQMREFVGKIEIIFKQLQRQIPEHYPNKSLLKDSLFHGMHQHSKDFLHYLYMQDSAIYAVTSCICCRVQSGKGMSCS